MAGDVVRSRSGRDGAADDITFPQANVVAVSAIAGALGTTLGPGSRDKLVIPGPGSDEDDAGTAGLQSFDGYVVTGDGATQLGVLPIEHPIGRVLDRIAGPGRPGDTDVEGEHISDGVTSTLVLLGALLEEGVALIERGLHPHTIRSGYLTGLETALETLDALARPIDTFADPAATERAVARSAMTGNDLGGVRERWAVLAAEAAGQVGQPDEVTFAVRTLRDGTVDDSRLVRGAVLDRNRRAHDAMPRRVEDATVLVLGGFGRYGGLQDPEAPADVVLRPDSPAGIVDLEAHWADRRVELVDRLVDRGVDVVVARGGISKAFQALLARAGILGVRAVNRLDLRQVAAATGARAVSDPQDLDPAFFGRCGLVAEQLIEPRPGRRTRRRMIVFDDCSDPASVALLLRGVSGQVAAQAETELRKAVAAVAVARGARGRPAGVVPGGGAADLAVADALRETAKGVGAREQLAITAFADAAQHLPWILASNAGVDPYGIIGDVTAAAADGTPNAGIFLPDGAVVDTVAAGVVDPLATRVRAYTTAVELATVVLNIDDAIDAVHTEESLDPDDAHYDDAAEQMRDADRARDG